MQSVIAPDGTNVTIYNSNDPSVAVPASLINSYSILTIPAYYRAIRFLAENLASFPRNVQKNEMKLDTAHPLDKLLQRRPNDSQSKTMFWRTLFFSAAHTNNGFARIERAGTKPVALHNLADGDVMPFRWDNDDGEGTQQYYYLRSTKTILFGDDVIHLSAFSLDGMVGIDPVHLHTDSFQRAKVIDKYVTRFLMKGTILKGAVEIPDDLTPDQLKEFRQMIRTNFQGADAQDDVMILYGGAKLNNATMSGSDAQLIEQGDAATIQVAQITGVHPHFLYADKLGKYNASGEQAGIDIVRYTFRPWMELIDDELTTKLLTDADQAAGFAIRLNANALTRGDSKTISATAIAETNAGLRTPNEGRELLELPPDEDPKSDALRPPLGDTSGKSDSGDTPDDGTGATPRQNARQPGKTFAATQQGQWEQMEGSAIELSAMYGDSNETTFSVKVHQSGAIGSKVAAENFPPGTMIDTQTAAGNHSFSVGEHAPHAHPNWVIPAVTQTAGGRIPGSPEVVTFATIANMCAGSRIMGAEPVVSVRKPQ